MVGSCSEQFGFLSLCYCSVICECCISIYCLMLIPLHFTGVQCVGVVLPMQRPASDGSGTSAGDRKRPNRWRGETFSLATSALPHRGPHSG